MSFAQGATDKKWITALGIDKRDWLPEVLGLNNERFLTDIMQLAGRYELAVNPLYSHFVDDALFQLLDTTGATVSGSGTATVGTTLTAGTSLYARKTDLVMFPNKKVGYVTNVVTSSGQDTLTIRSVDGSNLTHTAGQKLAVFSNAFGEASTQPVNRKFGVTKYTNKIQTFRDVNIETDIQMASQVEVSYNGSNYIIDRDLAIKELHFKAWINGAILGGEISATSYEDSSPSLTDPIAGGAVQTTRGIDSYIRNFGIVDAVASPGTWNFADMDDLTGQFLANKTGRRYMILRGTKAAGKMDAFLKGLASGTISSGQLALDARTIDFTMDGFTYSGFNYQYSDFAFIDNPDFFSQTDIVNSVYYIPLDSVKSTGGGDTKGGVHPRISMKYMPHNVSSNLGDEYIAETDTGLLARGGSKDGTAARTTHWLSHQGLQILGAKDFAKQTIL